MSRSYISLAVLALANMAVAAPTIPENLKNQGGGGVAEQLVNMRISEDGTGPVQMANFLQNLEVDFYKQGAEAAKDWKSDVNGVKVADVIKRIYAEEEAYVETLAELLINNDAEPVEPCKYKFPIKDEKSYLALASIITNVGIGYDINLENEIARTDPELVPHIARMTSVKSRYDAYFRIYNKEVPNPSAFETTVSLHWAYNLALDWVEPGSCHKPPTWMSKIPVYPDLVLHGSEKASYVTPNSPGALDFTVGQPKLLPEDWDRKDLWIGWANEDNKVLYTPVTKDGDKLKADLPEGLFGMVFAVLTDQKDAQTVADLSEETLAGPLPLPLGPGKYDK